MQTFGPILTAQDMWMSEVFLIHDNLLKTRTFAQRMFTLEERAFSHNCAFCSNQKIYHNIKGTMISKKVFFETFGSKTRDMDRTTLLYLICDEISQGSV